MEGFATFRREPHHDEMRTLSKSIVTNNQKPTLTMKSTNLLFAFLLGHGMGFAPTQRLTRMATLIETARVEDISHELEELGEEIKPQVLHQPHGFGDYHKDSLVHKLRRAMHEKDRLFHEAITELEKGEKRHTSMDALQTTLQSIQNQLEESRAYAVAWEVAETELKGERQHQNEQKKRNQTLEELQETLQCIEQQLIESRAFALAWETAEVELQNEVKEREKEHESLRRLLWQAAKLSARRVKNAVLWILPFTGKGKKSSK